MNQILVLLLLFFSSLSTTNGQNINLDEYEIYIGDTLISKSDFMTNSGQLDSLRLQSMSFKPITDGEKQAFYLNGQLYSKGVIQNKKQTGWWVYWHENGQKAREGSFIDGEKTGIHTYWYPTGRLMGSGGFKDDQYDGQWLKYDEEGVLILDEYYKKGKLIKQKE